MKTKALLIGTAAAIALVAPANAAHFNGWYVGLEGGANWVEDWDHVLFSTGGEGPTTTTNASASFDTGWAALATVGYGFSNNFRAELEVGYRDNDGDGYTTGGAPTTLTADLSEVTFMANVLYDIPLGSSLSLSVGAGAGADFAEMDFRTAAASVSDDHWSFAYQGIAGVNFALTQNTALFLNYRYLRVTDPEFDPRPTFTFFVEGDDIVKHTATVGLRYAFGATPEPVVYVEPPPPPPPEPAAPPKEFMVFFGHNKANLVPEALKVIREAAAAAKQFGSANIRVVGHADRSGSTRYNDVLSLRRANVVKDALGNEGIPTSAITVLGRGESEPLVPTADGVREPQNRRVNISM